MKFNCGRFKETYEEKHKRLEAKWLVWHRWFAWYPIRVAKDDCRWLEFVERRADYIGSIFNTIGGIQYRALKKDNFGGGGPVTMF